MGFNSISRRGTVTEPEDLYEVLQVHPSAHPEVIQAAYRRLAMLYHPDQNPSAEATQVMARINHAFEVLNDPDKRAEYDRGRQPSDAAHAPSRRSGTSALDYITIGSRKEDVARIQGPPDSITPPELTAGEEWWHYTGVGVYSLDKAGRVVDWSNFGGGLKIGMVPGPNVTTSELFTINSHKDDVTRLEGTPSRIDIDREVEFRNENDLEGRYVKVRERWHYPGGVVEFSISTGRVTAWENRDGSLKAWRARENRETRTFPPNAKPGISFFTLGSNEDEVRRIQGEPLGKEKMAFGLYQWDYGDHCWVVFGGWKVRGWSNIGRRLKVGLVPGPNATSAGFFSVGSHKDDVARLQPAPPWSVDIFDVGNRETWMFNGGQVYFSLSTGRVIFYENNDGTLRVQGIRPAISQDEAFENVRKSARDAREKSAHRFAFGCVGIVVAGFALLIIAASVCG